MFTLAIAVIAATVVHDRSGSAGKGILVGMLICGIDILFCYLMKEHEDREHEDDDAS